MDDIIDNRGTGIVAGKYRHFKGKEYHVYCMATDWDGNSFVLYRQLYGEYLFWIRPCEMFDEDVEPGASGSPRFRLLERSDPAESMRELADLARRQAVSATNSESGKRYNIVDVDAGMNVVRVHPSVSRRSSGYLTDYELSLRMGIIPCKVDGVTEYHTSAEPVCEQSKLFIGENDIETVQEIMNPCSIDLQIAKSGFLASKRRTIDPRSIEHVPSANKLWKKVKLYRPKDQSAAFIKLRPGNTVITHTMERIRIPNDCAGKVEIKSTFARLSLSITSGDFCNPGYDGYFPLEITNSGKHTIIIHVGETMAQLMLIPLRGPVLDKYGSKATHKNSKGYDEGTPYSFWRERSIKSLRKDDGNQSIIDLSERVLHEANERNTDDINEFRERFEANFLPFCQKHLKKAKYRSQDADLPDTRKLINGYVKKEKALKSLFSIKWASGILAVVCALIAAIPAVLGMVWGTQANSVSPILSNWPILLAAAVILTVVCVLLYARCPKTFCTFEGMDIEKLLSGVSNADESC